MEKTYNELSFIDIFKKHFSEVKNTVGSAGRLRLVVCKDHQRGIDKSNFVPKVIEKQAGHGTTFKVCLPAAEVR